MKLTGISRISTDSTGTDKVLKTLNNKGVSFLKTYSQPGPSFIILFLQYSQSDLPPLRPLCGEAPGPRLEPGTGWSNGRDSDH